MLICFTCSAYENIVYFEGVAKHLLKLMGHSGTVPGAIKAKDLTHALANLQKGLSKENNKTSPLSQEEDEEEPPILLTKRSLPLINQIKAAIKNDCDILWDYTKS